MTSLADALARFELPTEEGASKVTTLGEAIRTHVRPDHTVHVAYSDSRPNAAMLELVRQFAGTDANLTLTTAGLVSTQHALIESGVVRKVLISFAGENYPMARPSPVFQRAVREGRLEVENWSLWSLVARLMAGAMGVPFLPVRSLAGSGIAAEHEGRGYLSIDNPFGSGATGLVSALRPDVVLLQGAASDQAGNVIMAGPYGEGHWGSMAAKVGVIACVERIISTEELREHASLVRIPAHVVKAVCHVPFGSHPYGYYNPGAPGPVGYVQDDAFMSEVFRSDREPGGFARWIDEWVLGTRNHQEYLDKLGADRLGALEKAADPAAWRTSASQRWLRSADEPYSESEMMVVCAARRVAARVRAGGFDAVLAGVGQANLAAWLAVSELKQAGQDVELMSEIGMFGYDPRPGEPFIFAHRNLPTCKLMTDTVSALGTFVSGPGTRSLGVIGAGQVDREGNTNSTWTADGAFMVGSGGANDIATASDEVLVTVTHSRDRLVAAVPYITCPGPNVRTVVTSGGVFERVDGRFVLTAFQTRCGPTADEAVAAMRAESDWDFDVSPDLAAEPEPTLAELQAIRLFDPAGVFVRSGGVQRVAAPLPTAGS